MIGPNALSHALFDLTLPANARARLAPPPEVDGELWWRIGGSTWVQTLQIKSVQVKKPEEEDRSSQARFRADLPGLEVDEDADWVWASDAVKGLAAELVQGIVLELNASVPALPTRTRTVPPNDPQLEWPASGPGLPKALRQRRLEGLAALVKYLDRVAQDDVERPATAASAHDLSGRLIHHLSAIPRPTETRLSLSRGGDDHLVLSWEQTGNPDLLWGVSKLTWGEKSRYVRVIGLPADKADERRRLGAWAHLLAMATAVESATGGLAVPLQLRYTTMAGRPLTATITISPAQWGFDLPRLVQVVGREEVPEGPALLILS
jgi:hypothetical protein